MNLSIYAYNRYMHNLGLGIYMFTLYMIHGYSTLTYVFYVIDSTGNFSIELMGNEAGYQRLPWEPSPVVIESMVYS